MAYGNLDSFALANKFPLQWKWTPMFNDIKEVNKILDSNKQ
jgi:hypothetical protein